MTTNKCSKQNKTFLHKTRFPGEKDLNILINHDSLEECAANTDAENRDKNIFWKDIKNTKGKKKNQRKIK